MRGFTTDWLDRQRAAGRRVVGAPSSTSMEAGPAFATRARQKPREREHEMQCALIELARYKRTEYPALKHLISIPNGGARHPAVAAKLKAEGAVPGVSDLLLAVPRRNPSGGTYHGLWLELKAPGGRVRESQREWLDAMRAQGYAARVAWTLDEAWMIIEDYLNEKLGD